MVHYLHACAITDGFSNDVYRMEHGETYPI